LGSGEGHHFDGATGETHRHRHQRIGSRPVHHRVHARGEISLLDYTFESHARPDFASITTQPDPLVCDTRTTVSAPAAMRTRSSREIEATFLDVVQKPDAQDDDEEEHHPEIARNGTGVDEFLEGHGPRIHEDDLNVEHDE